MCQLGKKQHVVLCGHEATVSNPHRTFVAPVTRISEGRNKKSHRRAPRDAELFTPHGCRVLSIASPVNTHLPVQARERTALNRQNATSLLTIPIKGRALQGPSSSLTLSSQELWEVTLQQDSFASLTIPALCSARVIQFKRRHQQGLHVFIQ